MTALDHSGRQRLAALQERNGSERFQEVAPVPGTDAETGLSLTVDAARRVGEVRVPDVDKLRTPDRLRAAVRSAFHDADRARDLASREASGERQPQAAEIDVTPLLGPSRPSRRGIVKRARQAAANGVPTDFATTTLMATGRSGNGYLTVTIGPTGVVEDVDADPEWLAAAQQHYLEAALDEAFHAASQTLDGDPR
jgi:DNA-binding protein YbaB